LGKILLVRVPALAIENSKIEDEDEKERAHD